MMCSNVGGLFIYNVLFVAEGASAVYLALPVPELARPRRAQRARGGPLVSGGDQPHPELCKRGGTHRCPLQVNPQRGLGTFPGILHSNVNVWFIWKHSI